MGIENLLYFVLLSVIAEIIGTVGGFGSSLLFVPLAGFFLDFHSVLGIIAPPVPNKPAVNPERAPPLIELTKVGFKTNFLKTSRIELILIKNIAKIISNNLLSNNLLK